MQNIICEVINITILYPGTRLNVICLRFDKLISSFSSDIIRCNLIVSIAVGLNKGRSLIWDKDRMYVTSIYKQNIKGSQKVVSFQGKISLIFL